MNLVFDFGGVLFTWQPARLLREWLPHRAVCDESAARLVAEIFQGCVPGSDWASFDRGEHEAEALVERIARRTGHPADEVRRIVDAVPSHLTVQRDTVALMAELKERGHRLFYLSNMPAPYADHLEAAHDFLDWFEAGVFSARVGLIKPEPAIFRHAERVFGVPGERCVFIDDVAHNVEAARACGWQALQFTGAAPCREALVALGALD
ncbi:HAD family hydrolase [Caldimonas tepidiphila]|uniref:HAD family hydrolase n=1 Tax=Caldimonas tepidiphila TaxID=2315841 RepID=UPI000E5BED0F|nr:HAD family phosphatase [Caldimonas tepidiphila]